MDLVSLVKQLFQQPKPGTPDNYQLLLDSINQCQDQNALLELIRDDLTKLELPPYAAIAAVQQVFNLGVRTSEVLHAYSWYLLFYFAETPEEKAFAERLCDEAKLLEDETKSE